MASSSPQGTRPAPFPPRRIRRFKNSVAMPNRRSPLFLFGLTNRHHPLLKAVWVDPRCLNRRGPVRGPHMSNVELFERHPAARMSLTPEQHSHIAAAYDKAAFDVSLPAQTRAAFAKKADWFRLLARIGEKCQRAAPSVSVAKKSPANFNPFGFIAG